MRDTYVDLFLANIVSLLKRDENEGREGHVFLLSISESTLGCGAGSKGEVTGMSPHANHAPCRIVESEQGWLSPRFSQGGQTLVFILSFIH